MSRAGNPRSAEVFAHRNICCQLAPGSWHLDLGHRKNRLPGNIGNLAGTQTPLDLCVGIHAHRHEIAGDAQTAMAIESTSVVPNSDI